MSESAQSGDVEVLKQAMDWLEQECQPLLFTVADTWGSSPRRPGSLMLLHPDGRFTGSVSGGCVEDELVQRNFRGEFDDKLPRVLEHGVTQARAQQTGLPCGGRITLIAERLESAAQIRQILLATGKHQRLVRRLCLETGEVSLHPFKSGEDDDVRFDGYNLDKTFGPAWRLFIVGAGDLGFRVSRLANTVDWAVTLCDPRPEYAAGFTNETDRFVSRDPAVALEEFEPDERTAVLALSHSPALDDDVVKVALQARSCFYVGALGSRKNTNALRNRLQRKGVTESQLAQLHAPVGLAIGSHTPAEIAVAIMAELISKRNGITGKQQNRPRSHQRGGTTSKNKSDKDHA